MVWCQQGMSWKDGSLLSKWLAFLTLSDFSFLQPDSFMAALSTPHHPTPNSWTCDYTKQAPKHSLSIQAWSFGEMARYFWKAQQIYDPICIRVYIVYYTHMAIKSSVIDENTFKHIVFLMSWYRHDNDIWFEWFVVSFSSMTIYFKCFFAICID